MVLKGGERGRRPRVGKRAGGFPLVNLSRKWVKCTSYFMKLVDFIS